MKFDFVFDVQSAFRKLLHAFSYPGEMQSLQEEASHLEQSMHCFNITQVLMYMLLDTETNFHIVGDDTSIQQRFSQLTYSPHVSLCDAQFIFVLQQDLTNLIDSMKTANIGDLLDPQKGATFIVECDGIQMTKGFRLKGPGIKEENTIEIDGIEKEWMEVRNMCCEEYPLGIDFIFVDKESNCVVLPRTTRITR